MRWIVPAFLLLGWPAWFIFWLTNGPNVLVYLYAVMLYPVVILATIAWAARWDIGASKRTGD